MKSRSTIERHKEEQGGALPPRSPPPPPVRVQAGGGGGGAEGPFLTRGPDGHFLGGAVQQGRSKGKVGQGAGLPPRSRGHAAHALRALVSWPMPETVARGDGDDARLPAVFGGHLELRPRDGRPRRAFAVLTRE